MDDSGAKLDLILKAARILDSDVSAESSQSSGEKNIAEEEQHTIAYYENTDSEAEEDEPPCEEDKEGAETLSIHSESAAEMQESETSSNQETSELETLSSQPCGSTGRKRSLQESQVEIKASAIKKAKTTATHNQKERERRKDLKQAVCGLRNQLRKKPRRLTTKAVLQAAQSEIMELKAYEHNQSTEIDSLSKKGNYLEWQLKRLVSEFKSKPRPSRAPPRYPAAPTAPFLGLPQPASPSQLPSSTPLGLHSLSAQQLGMGDASLPRPSVPAMDAHSRFGSIPPMLPRPPFPQFSAIPPPAITSPPSFQGHSSPHLLLPNPASLNPAVYGMFNTSLPASSALQLTTPYYHPFINPLRPYQQSSLGRLLIPGQFSPPLAPSHQQQAGSQDASSVAGFPLVTPPTMCAHGGFFGFGSQAGLSMLPPLSQQSFRHRTTEQGGVTTQPSTAVISPPLRSEDSTSPSPRVAELEVEEHSAGHTFKDREDEQIETETHSHSKFVFLQTGELLTASSPEAVSPKFARSDFQSKQIFFSEREQSNGHSSPAHLEAADVTVSDAEEEEEDEEIDVESSSDDESKDQRYARVSTTTTTATAASGSNTYAEDEEVVEEGSDFLGQSSDGSESTTDSTLQHEIADDTSHDSESFKEESQPLFPETTDKEDETCSTQLNSPKKVHQNHHRSRKSTISGLPRPPGLIKISKSSMHRFTTSLTSSCSVQMTTHAIAPCHSTNSSTHKHNTSSKLNGDHSHFEFSNLPEPPALRSYQDSDKEAAMIAKVIEQVRPHRELAARMASDIILEKMNAFGFKKNGFSVYDCKNGNCKQFDTRHQHHQMWGLNNSDSDGDSCDVAVGKRKHTVQRVKNGKLWKQKNVSNIKRRFSKRRPSTHFHAVA